MVIYNALNEAVQFRDMVDSILNESFSKRENVKYPYVELQNNGENITVTAVIPGIEEKDLNIELTEKNLLIEGQKNNSNEDKNFLRRERVYGKFSKSIELPYEVNRDAIEAKLENGILTVSLTKSEAAKPRKIEIN